MEKDCQRFEFVPMQNQRPDEEQAESDNKNQRRGPLPLLEQPACLTPLCGRADQPPDGSGESYRVPRRSARPDFAVCDPQSCLFDKA